MFLNHLHRSLFYRTHLFSFFSNRKTNCSPYWTNNLRLVFLFNVNFKVLKVISTGEKIQFQAIVILYYTGLQGYSQTRAEMILNVFFALSGSLVLNTICAKYHSDDSMIKQLSS